ncbi:hypothetical protein D3C76_770880 [compost metagenome]
MIGYPHSFANTLASWTVLTPSSCPGIVGTPTAFATILDLILSPRESIISAVGPINSIPDSSHLFANSGFSDKNP